MSVYDKSGTLVSTLYDVGGNALTSAYEKNGNPVFPEDFSLKVMTYNVGQWYIGSGDNVPSDLDASFYALQNEIIGNNDPDILFVEEYSKQFSKTGRTALSLLQQYYPYTHETDGTGAYGYYLNRCVCSKYPISDYTVRTYSNDANRYFDSFKVNVYGTPIVCIITHLDAQSNDRRIVQATQLCNFVKTLNGLFIIGGDFNSTIFDPFSEANAAIYNQFIEYGCSIANGGRFGVLDTYCNGIDWENNAHAIDNIIVSPGITIDDVRTDLSKITNSAVLAAGKIDHTPLVAQLTLGDA